MHVRRRIKLLRYSGLTATTRIFFLPECIYLYTLVYGMRDVRRHAAACARPVAARGTSRRTSAKATHTNDSTLQ